MTRPIIIAHLIATNFYGGPEKQIVNHAIRLNKDRYRFILISFVEKGQPNQLIDVARLNGLEVVEVSVKNPFNPIIIWRIASILRKARVQILCAHGYKSNIIGRLSSWISGISQISISRGWTAENKKIEIYERLDKFFLKHTNHIVAVSYGQKEKILALGVLPNKVTVIHNAISLIEISSTPEQTLRKQLGLPCDALIVASAGRLSPEKNYGTMIDVAKDVITHNSKIYFVVFGEGFLRTNLEKHIESKGLTGRFLLPGFRTDLLTVMHEIDIFMLPSFTEGLPNVVLEAFAAKKPVVATRVGGTPEVVQEGISGFLAKPDESELMTQHVLALSGDPALRNSMGSAGNTYIREHFSFSAQTTEYEKLYTDMLQAKVRMQ